MIRGLRRYMEERRLLRWGLDLERRMGSSAYITSSIREEYFRFRDANDRFRRRA